MEDRMRRTQDAPAGESAANSGEQAGSSPPTAACPLCGATIAAESGESFVFSEIVMCPECGGELEVISELPLEFALAPEVEEDWGE